MAIRFISVKCPECGAKLPMEEGRTEMFCSYCGTKVIMTNDNEHIYRRIDEASIRKAEAKREIELKRIEYAEKQREAKEKHKKTKTIISIVIGLLSILFFIIGISVNGAYPLIIVAFFMPFSLMFMWLYELKGKGD